MSEAIDWSAHKHAVTVPFLRSVTLAAGTGVVFGDAPALPASTWTEFDPTFCFLEAVITGDATSSIRYSVDSAHAARLADERSQTLAATKSAVIYGPVGKIAIWNPEAVASVTVTLSGTICRQGNDTASYEYTVWPLTCDEADVKCDSSVITVDATYMP